MTLYDTGNDYSDWYKPEYGDYQGFCEWINAADNFDVFIHNGSPCFPDSKAGKKDNNK